jgi:precorrin-6B methylase 2
MSHVYADEIDKRFTDVVRHCVGRLHLEPGMAVLDLGTGTGAVALEVSALVGPDGIVTAVDLSPEMLRITSERIEALGLANIRVLEGRGEEIPADAGSFDAVAASLSLMYAIDREAVARECARVMRPGARLVAAVWGGPDDADIVRFQQTAGSFAPEPPVAGVGPGALADARPFVDQLAQAGIDSHVETEVVSFGFDDFESAWDVLAGVTTAQLSPERREEARAAVRNLMWPDGDGPRTFSNKTQFIIGTRA